MKSAPNQPEMDFSLSEKDSFRLVGTATSDWQNNPMAKGFEETDWGHELARKQAGKKSGITGTSNPELMPRFDEKYGQILPRAAEVGSNAFRMSLDFGRLCPREGEFNEELMCHYVRILAKCHFLKMEPVVTLNHWTLPKSFGEYNEEGRIKKGPLENPRIVDHFAFYVNRVADFLCDPEKITTALADEGYDQEFLDKICDDRLICRWFISLNEPCNMLTSPYMTGAAPPYQFLSFRKFPGLKQKLKKMHQISNDTLHNKANLTQAHPEPSNLKVGMAHQVLDSGIPLVKKYMGWGLVEEMEDGVDSQFMGIQYYCRLRLGLNGIKGPDPRYHSDMPIFGQIYAPGVYDVLKFASDKYPRKQLLMTEVGFADKTDQKRPAWIMESVYHLIKAKREGVNVEGVLLWSLIDNFEWSLGMDAPFGIFDKDGNRLQSDDGREGHVSSREVWTEVSKHLRTPTEGSAIKMAELQKRTNEQLNRSVGMVRA
jgi:beta-glucosidase